MIYEGLDERVWCDDCDALGVYDCDNCPLMAAIVKRSIELQRIREEVQDD